MTFYTDILLALLAVYCGLQISELYWQKYRLFHFHLSWAFYTLAFSAFLGAVSHGFGSNFPPLIRQLAWKLTVLSVGFTALFFLLAAFSCIMTYATYSLLRWIPIMAVVIYGFVIWRQSEFSQVLKFCGPAMAFVLIVMIYLYVTTGDRGAGSIITGLVISFGGALLWSARFSLHTHFNHNDIFHVIQMVGLWFIYRGGLAIQNILN